MRNHALYTLSNLIHLEKQDLPKGTEDFSNAQVSLVKKKGILKPMPLCRAAIGVLPGQHKTHLFPMNREE